MRPGQIRPGNIRFASIGEAPTIRFNEAGANSPRKYGYLHFQFGHLKTLQ